MEKRTLSAAYKFYCGKIHENAHSSLSDAKATYEVFKSQLEKYSELEKNIKFLSNFSRMRRNLDLSGYILENERPLACKQCNRDYRRPFISNDNLYGSFLGT